MMDGRLTDAELAAALRDYLPAAAPSGSADRLAAAIGATRQQRPLPALIAPFGDADTLARRRNLLLAAAIGLLATAMAAAAIGRSQPPAPDLSGAERGLLATIRHGDLYLAEPDGSHEILAVHIDGTDLSDPRWSPDGHLIAVRTDEPAILLIDATTLSVRRLASGDLGDWAPDADRLSLVTPRGALAVVSAIDGQVHELGPAGRPVMVDPYGSPTDWAPDGRSIVAAVGDAVVLVDVATGLETRVGALDGFGWYSADWSPDASRIAYVKDHERSGPTALMVVDRDGSHARQLIAADSQPLQPTWSPDGAWIAFTSRSPNPEDSSFGRAIEVVRPDGSDRRLLVREASGLVGWAPDGRSLAYTIDDPTDDRTDLELLEVRLADADSTVLREPSDALSFAWAVAARGAVPAVPAPSGTISPRPSAIPMSTPLAGIAVDPSSAWSGLAFITDLGRGCTAAVAGFDGSIVAVAEGSTAASTPPSDGTAPAAGSTAQPQPVGCRDIYWAPGASAFAHVVDGTLRVFDRTGVPLGSAVPIASGGILWSSDGRWLATTACPGGADGCDGGWFMMRPDGSDRHDLPGEPHWSADGRRLAARGEGSASPGLYVGTGDGSDLRNIGDVPVPVGWSPDGDRIAFIRDGNVMLANVDGSDVHDVSRQSLGGITEAAWSRDGRYIAALRGRSLIVFAADGGDLHEVGDTFTASGLGEPIDWAPDSRGLVATAPDGLIVVGLDGWRPIFVGGETAAWSPDGRYLALTSSDGSTTVLDAHGSGPGPTVATGEFPGIVWVP